MLRALIALLLFMPTAAFAAEPIVAVMYFKNEGNEEMAPLTVGLAEMMIADILGPEEYKVIERTRLEEILAELELSRTDLVDKDAALKVGKLLQCKWMVFGSYSDFMGNFQINAKLVEVETSETLMAEIELDKPKDFIDMERALSAKIKAELITRSAAAATAPAPSPAAAPAEPDGPRRGDGESGKAPAPAEPVPSATADATIVREDADTMAAAISFSEGLIYMDDKDMERARDSFAKAVEEDPGFDAAKDKLASLEL